MGEWQRQGQRGGGETSRDWSVLRKGTVCRFTMLLSWPPPASVWTVPASLCQEPDLKQALPGCSLLPALFVFCLTSLSALFFSHKELVPAKGRTGQHLLWQETSSCQLLQAALQQTEKLTETSTSNRRQQCSYLTRAALHKGLEDRLQTSGWHSTDLTTSWRSPLMFSLATSSTTAQRWGRGKEEGYRALV